MIMLAMIAMIAMIAKVMNIFNIGIYLIKFETAPVVRSFECFLL